MPKEKKKTTKPKASVKKSRRTKQQIEEAEPTQTQKPDTDFPIVGIGASAGGLEAFIQLLNHLPDDLGMAFVFIQHLDPKHESKLSDLISRVTKMKVNQLANGEAVQPNRVYIIPPNADIEISKGILKVLVRKVGRSNGIHMPIDYFFRSLANSQKSKAIGIVLSGTGSDGTLGTQEIKEQGGITFAQEERSAKYEGMPRSAISAGYVDFILPVEEIVKELKHISKHPYISRSRKEVSRDENHLRQIFHLLRKQKQVDFSHYKRSTIERRIMRRMAVNRISTLSEYSKILHENPGEVQALFQDMLIKVTGFFRDPATFQVLKTKIFPRLIKGRTENDPIRIWIPGCATGEEAYSIAICLLEFLDKKTSFPIQLFATDVSEWAVERARSGQYVENIALDVSQQRLRRFFSKIPGGYLINKAVRDLCVFARHDITSDPPFSHIDVISCRNLLIYLEPSAQKRVIPVFHYALKPRGYFVLGSAESLGSYSDLFTVVDKRRNVYQKRHHTQAMHFQFQLRDLPPERAEIGDKGRERPVTAYDINTEADRIILGRFAPAGVIINEDLQIVQFRGQTGVFLEPAPGEASLNLMRMARGNLPMILRPLIHKAIKENILVEKQAVEFRFNGSRKILNIDITPLDGLQNKAQARYLLVLFEDVSDLLKKTTKKPIAQGEVQQQQSRELMDIQRELQATKEYLQATIEEQEASNEELKSANEEVQSANEELQSTNEELETNKEELQSANEELTTLNEELQNRNAELDHVNNDLTNLLHSINIPILMLGNELKIRWFTPATQRVFNVIQTEAVK